MSNSAAASGSPNWHCEGDQSNSIRDFGTMKSICQEDPKCKGVGIPKHCSVPSVIGNNVQQECLEKNGCTWNSVKSRCESGFVEMCYGDISQTTAEESNYYEFDVKVSA